MITLATEEADDSEVDFDWASHWARHIGSIVHRWLQQIAEDGVEHWDAARVKSIEPVLRHALRCVGVAREHQSEATRRVTDTLCAALMDSDGRWLLSAHTEAENEYPITTIDPDANLFHNNIIDRTFICEDGIRWIIDYKTGAHQGADIDAFINSEAERYQLQLARYRDAFCKLDDRPVRTALYFPLLQVLHIVSCEDLQRSGH